MEVEKGKNYRFLETSNKKYLHLEINNERLIYFGTHPMFKYFVEYPSRDTFRNFYMDVTNVNKEEIDDLISNIYKEKNEILNNYMEDATFDLILTLKAASKKAKLN